jgi:phosphomevalonate kinase
MTVRLTVPGNILLLGEYAVLEEGGLGLAMAVETRVQLEASPAPSLSIEGTWPGSSISWIPDRRGTSPLVEAVVDTVSEWLGRPVQARVHVDSSAFFTPDGRKAGLGSSAAVSVALVCGLLRASGQAERAPDVPGPALHLALQAHRLSQGGRGSGYDVFTSFHGGLGIFRGGASPAWEPCTLEGDPGVLLFPGPAPVSTAESVARYSQWKKRNPGPARDFLRESNSSILSFAQSGSPSDARKWLGACRKLGIELGRSIGVPAELPVPAGLDPLWCKSLGAGNELGLCLLPRGARHPADAQGVRMVRRAETGVAWAE